MIHRQELGQSLAEAAENIIEVAIKIEGPNRTMFRRILAVPVALVGIAVAAIALAMR